MPCKYNDPNVFDPEKKDILREVRKLRKSLVSETARLKTPKNDHPYDIALNIQSIKEDIKLMMLELRPYVV